MSKAVLLFTSCTSYTHHLRGKDEKSSKGGQYEDNAHWALLSRLEGWGSQSDTAKQGRRKDVGQKRHKQKEEVAAGFKCKTSEKVSPGGEYNRLGDSNGKLL